MSFFARLPEPAQQQLLATAHEEEVFVRQNVYRESPEPRFAFLALVIDGLLRSYVTSPRGRQMVSRYWRPGGVVGLTSVVTHGAPTGVEVVRRGSILRLDPLTLERLAKTDAQVSWVVAEELAARVVDAATARVPNMFGSVKVRVAWHLLELATDISGRQAARVTQQELADSVGSVREVVARVLLQMSNDGLLSRDGAVVVIEDTDRLKVLSRSFDD
jgi:CRP/FNR family transcriptional regulator, cyclic AMP receptor protein